MRWAGPTFAALTWVAVGTSGSAVAHAQPVDGELGPRMSSDQIGSPRGSGAHAGDDGLQRPSHRRTRFTTPDACTKLCMREADFERLRACTLQCAESEEARRESPPGTNLIGVGFLVTVLGAAVFVAGVGGICDATTAEGQPEESMGACGAGMLVGGLSGMVLGPILAVFGLEQGRPDRQTGSSGMAWRF